MFLLGTKCSVSSVFTFQQKLWKKKYDFSKANRIIKEVTRPQGQHQQQEKQKTESNCDTNVPCEAKSASNNVVDSNIAGANTAAEQEQNTGLESTQEKITDCERPTPAERFSPSGAVTDEGEIRLRPEEKRKVCQNLFKLKCKKT